mgnify:CR=1 FL=1
MEFYQEIERGLTGRWRKPIWRSGNHPLAR